MIVFSSLCWVSGSLFFLQVNSDVVFYSQRKDGTMQPVKVNRSHVGRLILTKTPGDVTRRDITHQYKFLEGQCLHPTQHRRCPFYKKHVTCENTHLFHLCNPGSTEEQTVLEKAEEYGCKRDKSDLPVADVDLVLPTMEISVGDDFELSLEFVNRSNQQRTVDTYISGSVVYYTGVNKHEFLLRDPTVKISPNTSMYWLYIVDLKNKLSVAVVEQCCIFCVLQVLRR